MRRLNRKKAFYVVKELDAFTKVPEDYVKKSSRGGGLSLLSFSLILFLVISEFIYYTNTVYKYEYTVDKDCLLYTSPSPRDRQKSRMPSSA